MKLIGLYIINIMLCIMSILVKAENKYSKEANTNFGKSNILYEPEVNVRTLEKPFRMNKLNLLWTKARVVSFFFCNWFYP